MDITQANIIAHANSELFPKDVPIGTLFPHDNSLLVMTEDGWQRVLPLTDEEMSDIVLLMQGR